jgi:hypothetical protein
MDYNWQQVSKKTAEDHVTWYLNSIRPLLIDHLVHGFKHGIEYEKEIQKLREIKGEPDD